MKKKTLLLTTLAGTMLVAGMTGTSVKAAVSAGTKATIKEDTNSAFVELATYEDVLTRADLVRLVNEKYSAYGVTATKITVAEEEITEENNTAAVGTGVKVELSNGKTLTLVVYGDLDANGEVGLSDLDLLSEVLVGNEELGETAKVAADIAEDLTETETVDTNDLDVMSEFLVGNGAILDEGKALSDTIEVNTVHFIDTLFGKNEDRTVGAGGKLSVTNTPNLTDDSGKYRLLGWTENPVVSDTVDVLNVDFVNFDELEIEDKNTNLYSVWGRNVKAIVNLHYPDKESEEGEIVRPLPGEFLAGMTINLTELEKDAEYTSEHNGIKYTQTGWYVPGDDEQPEHKETYVIAIPSEPEQEQEEERVVVDIYPTWDISVSSVNAIDNDTIGSVLTELEALQKIDEDYFGTVVINSEVNLSSPLDIPEGITVTFNDDVTVNAEAALSGNVIHDAEKVTITKMVNNSNVTDATTGLNVALNNDLYDVVKLEDSMTNVNGNIKVEQDEERTKAAVLDLNGKDLKLNYSSTFENDGNLTILNTATDKDGSVYTKEGITNKGNLIIGEKTEATDADETKNIVIRNYKNSTGSTVINCEGATLTIESGTIENVAQVNSEATVKNEKGGTLIVEGGKIDQTDKTKGCPALLNEGTATISGGEISRSGAQTSGVNKDYVVINHGTMTITDGIFTEGKVDALDGHSSLIENGYYTALEAIDKEEANLTIEGGTFNGGKYIIKNDYAGIATVTGGKYTANPQTTGNVGDVTSDGTTRSIFKTIGEMTLDFSEATAEDTAINLGAENSKTALVLVGDQKVNLTESLNSLTKNSITVKPFDPSLVKLGDKSLDAEGQEEAINQLIVVEKTKDSASHENSKAKSKIVVYVGNDDPIVAGKQLLTLIKNFVAKDMQGVSAYKNTVEIILDSNVEIPAQEPAEPGYELTKENTTLYLNGKTLKIHSLYTFSNNITVEDGPEEEGGRILLTSELTDNNEKDLFVNGSMLPDEQLKEFADKEIANK